MFGRDGLTSLMAAARRRDCPFDCILIDDTSRLSRNLGDVLKLAEIIRTPASPVYIRHPKAGLVSGGIAFRMMLSVYGIVDEQYIRGLAEKTRRGIEGRVLHGFVGGGRTYGYNNVPIPDTSGLIRRGRAATVGVDFKVNDLEAAIVLRIFQMYADGHTMYSIVRIFNQERIPGPTEARSGVVRKGWGPTSVKQILFNKKYIGIHCWNKTFRQKDPESGKRRTRLRSSEEIVQANNPNWRIVPDDLWNRAHDRFTLVKESLTAQRLGGLCRSGKPHLLSGLLFCGLCDSPIVIVAVKGRHPHRYRVYGCKRHRFHKGCLNKLFIREKELACQLLEGLSVRILQSDMLTHLITRATDELDKYERELAQIALTTPLEKLAEEKSALVVRLDRLIDAIGDSELSESKGIKDRIKSTEAELELVLHRIDIANAKDSVHKQIPREELQSRIVEKVKQLFDVCETDVVKGRQVLQEHIRRIVITPVATPDGLVCNVSGDISLFTSKMAEECVMLQGSSNRTLQHYTSALHVPFCFRLIPTTLSERIKQGRHDNRTRRHSEIEKPAD